MAAKKKVEKVQYYGTGRRKASVARVFLTTGTGKIVVNGRDVNEYMPYATLVMDLKQPLELTSTADKFDINCTVKGGGFSAQASAVAHGISKALASIDLDTRTALKRSGLITRDSRVKERRKYGLKKARKAPQFSKR